MKQCKLVLSMLAVVLAASTFSSCGEMGRKIARMVIRNAMSFDFKDSEQWGKVISKNLELSPFTELDASGVVKVILVQDTTTSVRVEGNEKCVESYNIEVRRGELKVSLKNDDGKVSGDTPAIALYVAVPSLSKAEFRGGSEFHIQGNFAQDIDMDIDVSGAGNVKIDTLSVRNLDVEISGAADITMAQVEAVEDVEMEISGAGDVRANTFSKNLRIEMGGACNAVLTGECTKLIAEENGASNLDFSGLKRNVKR